MKSRFKKLSFILFATIFSTQNLFAQVKPKSVSSDTLFSEGKFSDLSTNINFLGLFLKSVGALILIAVLIFVTVYFLRQIYKVKNGKGYSNNFVNIIGSTFLSPKKSIYLIEVCERILVLGVTDTDINILTEFNKDELSLNTSKVQKEMNNNLKGDGFPERLTQVFAKMGIKK